MILILVIIGFVGLSDKGQQINWNDLAGNLVAETFGICITVFILDFIIAYNEERRNQKIGNIAFTQMHGQLNKLLELIRDQYEAVSGIKLDSTNLDALLTEEVAKSICDNLRPSENPPVRYERPTTWEEHNRIFTEKFKTDIDMIIDKYLLYIPEDLILVLEKLKNTSVFVLFTVSRSYRALLSEKNMEDRYLQGTEDFYEELFKICNALEKQLRVFRE